MLMPISLICYEDFQFIALESRSCGVLRCILYNIHHENVKEKCYIMTAPLLTRIHPLLNHRFRRGILRKKDKIVLGFKTPDIRKYTGYAVS